MASIFTVIKFYDKWNIQVFVLLSLCLQIILLLFAPFRKRSRNPIIIVPIWLAYVLADWAASYAIGLISNHQSYSPKRDGDRTDILAFWATFLLLHLGGPDNVSAFALEDNTFWVRHLIGLISQVFSTVTVFGQPLPRKKSWISTILVFVAGTIKYGERTYTLYSANLSKYTESLIEDVPKPSYAEDVRMHVLVQEEPRDDELDEAKLSDVKVVEKAYELLEICKGLIADVIPEDSKLTESRSFFLESNSTDAFRVLEVELNLIYEVFYTKVFVVYSKYGCIFRFISWCAVVAALLIFSSIDKHGFRNIDVKITYALLFGTIGLDTIALFMIAISDWAVVFIKKFSEDDSWKGSTCKCFLSLLKYFLTLKRIKRVSEVSKFGCFDWVRKFLFGFFYWLREILFWRWSGSLHTYNFIDYCLKERHRKNPISISFLKDFYDRIKYVSKEPVEKMLWKLIFTQLLEKAKKEKSQQDASMKLRYHDDDYYRTLLIWHIATDLCYENNKLENYCVYHKMSKILSDYMLSLLVMQPTFMSAVSGVIKNRFCDTSGHAKAFFRLTVNKMNSQRKERAEAREKCFNDYFDKARDRTEGVKSQSVLGKAINLAKELEKMSDPYKRWKQISEAWVELLSYAASHCRAEMHIAQLSKGGEFITFVWLLMAHLGLKDDFKSYSAIAKMAGGHMKEPN